jgi:hypothetical protein
LQVLLNIVKTFGPFIPEQARLHAKYVSHDRIVSASFFQGLLSMPVKDNKMVLLRMALLKAESTCPDDKVLNKYCGFISSSDIAACCNPKKHMARAIETEAALRKVRELVENNKAKINTDAETRLYGFLDCAMARFVVQKQKQSKIEYTCVDFVASAFWKQLKDILGDSCPPNPWKENTSAEPAGPSTAPPGPDGMASYSALGDLIPADLNGHLKSQGFSAGDTVLLKNGNEKATITPLKTATINSIDSQVHVKFADDSTEAYDYKKFMSSFRVYEQETYPFLGENTGKGNTTYLQRAALGHASSALAALSQTCMTPDVTLYKKPFKAVVAEWRYTVGSLVLIPESCGIVIAKPDDKAPQNAAHLGENLFGSHGKMYITPSTLSTEGKPLNVPFWLVRRSKHPNEVNMEFDVIEITSSIWTEFDQVTHTIKVPVLKNKKDVEKGEELVVFIVDDNKAEENDNVKGPEQTTKLGKSGAGSGKGKKRKEPQGKGSGKANKKQKA